jgi:hypothetical protein
MSEDVIRINQRSVPSFDGSPEKLSDVVDEVLRLCYTVRIC